MKKSVLSTIAAVAFGLSSIAFATGALAGGGCGGFKTVSTPDPVTTADTETSTPAPSQSQESG